MFAGAAREAVFSNPEVVRRINSEFVPVALKAALLNSPTGDIEGRIYQEIGRSKIAPQGICVANSEGRALMWTEMFDDEKSVGAFLDHALELNKKSLGAEPLSKTERYMRFPGRRMEDIDFSTQEIRIGAHASGEPCPAKPALAQGTLVVRTVGRALGSDGGPNADTASQERYVEDRFEISPDMCVRLANLLGDSAASRVEIPQDLAQIWVSQAYLGELDVRPLANPVGSKGELRTCEFWVTKDAGKPGTWRITGKSDVFTDRMANAGGGDSHTVKLDWEGFLELKDGRIAELILSARGTEKLKLGSARPSGGPLVSQLPAGRRIDMSCDVRFGFVGKPATAQDWGQPMPGGPPRSLQEKMMRLQSRVEAWQREGKDLSPAGPLFQKLDPLLKQSLWKEAEQVMDEILKLLGG